MIKNKKIITILLTLQESFTSILPYILIIYLGLTFYSISFFFKPNLNTLYNHSYEYLKILNNFLSFVIAVSISYFIAIRIKTSPIMASILSFITVLSIIIYENGSTLSLPVGMTPASIIMPFISTYILKILYPKMSLNINFDSANFHILRIMNYLFAFLGAFIISMFLYMIIDFIFDTFIDRLNNTIFTIPHLISLIFRDFFSQLFWFFGIHGGHVMYSFFGNNVFKDEMFKNLKYIEFHRLFVNIGGAGAGLPMIIALLFTLKNKTLKLITKISFPFTLININTLVLYAIIVLNRFFLIPFLLIPILNILIAYFALQIIHVEFTSYNLIWTTPPLIDSYLKSGGNIYVIILQITLIFIDTLIYYYFAKKFIQSNSTATNKEILETSLEIPNELKSKEGILAFKVQKELIAAQSKLSEIIKSLNQNNLKIFYQPKVDIKNNRCIKYEALIRYTHNGKTTGPIFLHIIEKAGLAPIIDIWVCKEVKKHLDLWKKKNFYPQISVNLHPDTIKSKDAVSKVISILKGENIIFEIIERSLLDGNTAEKNIKRIFNNGFNISIDDFGTGYSNLKTIAILNIEELKIDKSLIDIIQTHRGFSICKHIIEICHDLDIKVVSEGVETKEQLKTVKAIDTDLVQGYIFAPALPFEKIPAYQPKIS